MNVNKDVYSTREAAKLLGVSVKTIQLWVESGVLRAWKTPGGHRRVSRESVQLLQDQRLAAIRSSSPIEAERTTTTRIPSNAGPGNRRFSILAVDDEEDVRALYESVIASWSLPITLNTSADGFDALVRIGSDPPDMLIADLAMPGMDGFRMLRFLHANPVSKHLRVVVVSGLDETEIKQNGGLPPRVTYFQKPIPFDQLRAFIDAALAAR